MEDKKFAKSPNLTKTNFAALKFAPKFFFGPNS